MSSRCSWRNFSWVLLWVGALVCGPTPAGAQNSDVVIYASDVGRWQGNWTRAAASSAAGSEQMVSTDYGWSTANTALAGRSDFFELNFSAPSYTTYHVWVRVRASGDSKWNDSVWLQFNDAMVPSGSAAYRIGTSDGLAINLEPCYACGVSGWGWVDNAYWLSQPANVMFAASGSHTLRVQTREDGVRIDQIVLSPSNYLWGPPGQIRNDATIVPKSGGSPPPPGPPGGGGSLPAMPASPNPPVGTVGVTVLPALSWQASGGTSYELRLGTSNPPGAYANLGTTWTGVASALA